MHRLFLILLLLCLSIGAAWAQPLIAQHGIVNAGSYIPFGLPGGAIARGSVFSIFGAGLGPPSSPPLAFPLATTLGGVSIKVSNADSTVAVDAIPLYVSPTQINAILPSNAPLGPASVVVTYSNARSNPSTIRVAASAFGIYAISSAGYGPGVLQNYNSPTDQPVNSLQTSAQPGQVITLWGTGLGAVSFADNVAPTPGSLATPVEVFVGGKLASVQYSGRSPCCSGTDQIVFTIPADAPTGCWVPVQVRTEGTTVSNTVTIAIGSSAGAACNEAANPFAMRYVNGGRLGWVDLRRFALHSQPINLTIDTTVDYSAVLLRNEPGGPFAFNAVYSLPPAGSCGTYYGSGDLLWKDALPGTAFSSSLNGGASVNVGVRRTAAISAPTLSYSRLGYYQTGITTLKSSLILNPGTVQVQGAGGPDVGTFIAATPLPAPLTWSNRDLVSKTVGSQATAHGDLLQRAQWPHSAHHRRLLLAVHQCHRNVRLCRARRGDVLHRAALCPGRHAGTAHARPSLWPADGRVDATRESDHFQRFRPRLWGGLLHHLPG